MGKREGEKDGNNNSESNTESKVHKRRFISITIELIIV